MNVDMTLYDLIFRTAHLHEITLARDILQSRGIPHQADEENIGGVRSALGVEATGGLGICWNIKVDPNYKSQAIEVLEDSGLMLTTNYPDIMTVIPKNRRKWITIGGFAIILAWAIMYALPILAE